MQCWANPIRNAEVRGSIPSAPPFIFNNLLQFFVLPFEQVARFWHDLRFQDRALLLLEYCLRIHTDGYYAGVIETVFHCLINGNL